MGPIEPKVFIIIPNWNGKEGACECINSLKKLDYKNYEIIVVDNASSDGSPEYLRKRFPDLKIIINSVNLGSGGGYNVGIRYALYEGTDYILLVDNNAVVDSKTLSILIDTAEADEEIAVAGPKIYCYGANRIHFAGGFLNRRNGSYIIRGYKQEDTGQFDKTEEVDYIQGACFLIRANVFKKIGLFDSDYFILCNDTDICFRAKQSGYKVVYVPEALAWHKEEATSFGSYGSPRYRYYSTRNRLIFIRKNMAGQKRVLCTALMEVFRDLFVYLKALRKPKNFKYTKLIRATFCAIVDFIFRRYGKGPEWLYK